jgi:anti-sigma B factor antagonist
MAAIEFRLKNIRSGEGITATLAEMTGSIDATTVESFSSVMDKLLEKDVKRLVLDCAGIKYINSTGLGILLKYVDAYSERGGGIVFTRVPQKVMLVMEMLGFNALFNIVADEAVALKSFSGAEVPPASVQVAQDIIQPPVLRAPAAPPQPARPAAPAPAPAARAAAVFPLSVSCPRCRLGLKLVSAGRFKCPRCSSVAVAEDGGELKFFASRRAKPVELSLPASPGLADALQGLIGGVARQMGLSKELSGEVAQAVSNACGIVAEHACSNDPNSVYHVILVPNGKQLTVKISDYGTPLEFPAGGPAADARFRETAKVLEVEHALNPAGGNLFTLISKPE